MHCLIENNLGGHAPLNRKLFGIWQDCHIKTQSLNLCRMVGQNFQFLKHAKSDNWTLSHIKEGYMSKNLKDDLQSKFKIFPSRSLKSLSLV